MSKIINLSVEVRNLIFDKLSLNDIYYLHKVNKDFAIVIKEHKLSHLYIIHDENLIKKNCKFLHETIQHVKIDLHTKQPPLMAFLKNFTHLESIDIRDIMIDNIPRFVQLLERTFSEKELFVKICRIYTLKFEKAAKIGNLKFVDTRIIETKLERSSRESTPEELYVENEDFERYKLRIKSGIKSDDIGGRPRVMLNMFELNGRYKVMLDLKIPPYDKNDMTSIGETVVWLGNKFVNSVFVSNSGCWITVTQIEIYYKDVKMDDCSNSSPVPKTKKKINITVESKGEGRSWVEMKVYVDNFEILVTGGLMGYDSDPINQFDGFLGASTSRFLKDEQYWVAYFPEIVTDDAIQFERLLRKYRTRRDSRNQWAFKSAVFAAKLFCTASPFHVVGDNEFVKIVSVLIDVASTATITSATSNKCLSILYGSKFWKELHSVRRSSDEAVLTYLKGPECKLGSSKKLLLVNLLEFKDGVLEKTLIDLYNSIMYPYLKRRNSKCIESFRALYR